MNDDLPQIPIPDIDWTAISPILIVAGVALVGVLVEAFCPRAPRFVVQTVLAAAGTVAAGVAAIWVYTDLEELAGPVAGLGGPTGDDAIAVDGPGVITWIMLTLFALLSIGLFADRRLEAGVSAFTGRAADVGTERV